MSVLMLNTRVQHISALKTDWGFFDFFPSFTFLNRLWFKSAAREVDSGFICLCRENISFTKINYSYLQTNNERGKNVDKSNICKLYSRNTTEFR